jgi:inhibitor of KinA
VRIFITSPDRTHAMRGRARAHADRFDLLAGIGRRNYLGAWNNEKLLARRGKPEYPPTTLFCINISLTLNTTRTGKSRLNIDAKDNLTNIKDQLIRGVVGDLMLPYRVLTAGDTAVVIEFGDAVDRQLNSWVLALARRLNEGRLEGIVETVATFRSLMVYYDPIALPTAALVERVAELMEGINTAEPPSRLWRLPVCYDSELAPDLADVAERTGLTCAGVIERHASVTYHVYMLGFLPGFAYLGDVPAELALPRRATPRVRVPAGSVAVAMTLSCIFPRESPSGWHVIGRSPAPLWRHQTGTQFGGLLVPGDKVEFTPVSVREYKDLRTKAAEGALTIAPVEAGDVAA